MLTGMVNYPGKMWATARVTWTRNNMAVHARSITVACHNAGSPEHCGDVLLDGDKASVNTRRVKTRRYAENCRF